ncbi:hypothetical protein SISNIDRAFT_413960 [Sistotremastrum niveocremeum HHB9708]|uniref:DUF6535 domain-containing protein n=1 Tax=Sistotremastrum niveocremeum HHB9708 TaxID=1314777 RepID=A0A164SEP1_9AGAM|nr:hypothetical protein SISNIDRAFT_413960 [Sistotremastrum niveocremeum HHB9708]
MAGSWKESLDTTLLFIALFSAIVTAFLLATLNSVSPAPGQGTEPLLKNLTEIIYQIALMNGMNTPNVSAPVAFVPAASDEIAAAFWYGSLILSVSQIFSSLSAHAQV